MLVRESQMAETQSAVDSTISPETHQKLSAAGRKGAETRKRNRQMKQGGSGGSQTFQQQAGAAGAVTDQTSPGKATKGRGKGRGKGKSQTAGLQQTQQEQHRCRTGNPLLLMAKIDPKYAQAWASGFEACYEQ